MSDDNLDEEIKFYQLYGINNAVHLLRPGAMWEITDRKFTRWDDPRPCPTWEEVEETMQKLKDLEDSVDSIWTNEQIEKYNKENTVVRRALKNAGF